MRHRILVALIASGLLLGVPTFAAGTTPVYDGFCTVTFGVGGMVLRLSGYNVLPACRHMAQIQGPGAVVERATTPRSPALFCIRRYFGHLVYVWTPSGFPLALTREACSLL